MAEVEFRGGEMLVGTTIGYDLNRLGFFWFPVDSQSNNIKVLAVSSSVKGVSKLTE